MNIEIGAAVRIYTTTTDDAGIIHAPDPLEVGDVIAREHGPPLRVLSVVAFDPGGRVGAAAVLKRAAERGFGS